MAISLMFPQIFEQIESTLRSTEFANPCVPLFIIYTCFDSDCHDSAPEAPGENVDAINAAEVGRKDFICVFSLGSKIMESFGTSRFART